MPRILLLLPTSTYRAKDFIDAARKMGVETVTASEEPSTMEKLHPGSFLTINFRNLEESVRIVGEFHRRSPLDAVIPVDDDTAVSAAAISSSLSLKHNSIESARAARNKHLFSELLRKHGLPAPQSRLLSIDEDPRSISSRVTYPCVLKPIFLSASRGVIRADEPLSFQTAWARIRRILRTPEARRRGGESAGYLLVQEYIPGEEYALEGLLQDGTLRMLTLFDKPDPLEGPFFEETIYITPSRLPSEAQSEIRACVENAARAIGLREGPVHAEARRNDRGIWILELAARSIGGLCARTLRFGTGLSLEELILRHALNLETENLSLADGASGVMMIPIPRRGVLRKVDGREEALLVPGIEDVTVTATLDREVVPLPEGSSYLGFIFARGNEPGMVESALREAHRRMHFEIEEAAPPPD